MRRSLLFSLLFFFTLTGYGQSFDFRILPYMAGITSVREGLIEVGPELNWENIENGNILKLRPTFRMPLTNSSENVLKIDRYTSTWRAVIAGEYIKDNTEATGRILRNSFSGQFEYGYDDYTYYPMGPGGAQQKDGHNSYSFEIKYVGFFTKGIPQAKQFSPQFRLRYSKEWRAAGVVGVVNPPDNRGISTITNLIIDPPYENPVFSPAFSLQIYPGKGNLSYSPAIYYDFTGKAGSNSPFGNHTRLRIESWIFFYPLIIDNPNIKIGLSPFLSIETYGSDNFRNVEYGGLITIKFGTTFLQFF